MRFNPTIDPESIKNKSNNAELSFYKDPYKVLFKKPLDHEWHLSFDIKPWPETTPYENHYLLVKKGNKFSREKDTLYFPEYEVVNKFFPHDERFLVYYDSASNDIYFISGNFVKDRANRDWLDYSNSIGALKFSLKVLAQYEANKVNYFLIDEQRRKYVYDSLLITDQDHYYLSVKQSSLSSGYLILKVPRLYPYEKYEIIYFTNNPVITGSNNPKDLYEVKYVSDYHTGFFPETYQQNKAAIRKITNEELKILQKKFHNTLSLFFDGKFENSIFEKIVSPD